MRQIPGVVTTIGRRLLRHAWQLVLLVAGAFGLLVLGYTLYAVNMLPDLKPWHTGRLSGEYSAITHRSLDFAGYLALEADLFREAGTVARSWSDSGESFTFSRFNPAGNLQRLAGNGAFNRSFRLTPASPVGGVLLVHGLTDSPYSMKSLAEALERRGFEVTVLRLPGHGLFPGMLTEVHYRDWMAAVRLAARDVALRTAPDQPFYVGGYSMGATLTLTYALDALHDPGLRRPDRVLLLSPAVELTRVAALANVIDVLSIVPLQMLEKVRWQDVQPEFDPYKYNSFPVNAARQVNRATKVLRTALRAAEQTGNIGNLPPVLTWQSVVDSTTGSVGTVHQLYARLAGSQHRLVLFDVNRSRMLSSVQRPAARNIIDQVIASRRQYTLEVVANSGANSLDIVRSRLAPGSDVPVVEPVAAAWPADIASLGHVALPFPPDDPVYGFLPGSGRDGVPSLGSLLLRGESGALTISLGALTRLRSNPFWTLIDQQLGEAVAADLEARGN